MSRQVSPDTKYAVRLGVLANSFYDVDSKANLFKGTPYYFFNHMPTNAIKNAVKSGRLIDLKGNVLKEEQVAVTGINPVELDQAKAQIAQLTKELGEANAQIVTLTEENEALKAEVKAAEKVAKKTQAKSKEKASDEE